MMKRILLSLLIAITAADVFAQTGTVKGETVIAKYLFANERLYIPDRDTNWIPSRNGAVTQRPADGIMYQYYAVAVGPDWTPLISTGGGGGAVSSVFGRTGAVTALAADYNAFYPLLSGSYNNPTWLNQLAWSKITGTPTTLDGYGITDALKWHLINGVANVGSGSQIGKDTSSNKINLRSIVAGYGLDGTQNTNDVTLTVDTTNEIATLYDVSQKLSISAVLNDLTDVTITSVASGNILQYNGSQWVNVPGSTLPATSGTFAQRPGSPVGGQMYYQTDAFYGMYIYDGDAGRWRHSKSNTSVWMDFVYQTMASAPHPFASSASGAGAGTVFTQGQTTDEGQRLTVQTGTTTTGFSLVSASFFKSGVRKQAWHYRVGVDTLSDATNRYQIMIAPASEFASNLILGGIYFLYSDNVNSGQWQCITRNSGGTTTTNTSVAADVLMHDFDFIFDPSGTPSVKFYIDGVLVATHTTNIPPDYGYSKTMILKSAGTVTRKLSVRTIAMID